MSVARVGSPVDGGDYDNVSSKSFSFTATGGANNILVVDVGYYDAVGAATATATFNGVSMASLHKKTGTTGYTTQVESFGLINPPAGTYNVVITFSAGGQYGGAGAQEYSGVDSTTPVNGLVSAEGSNTSSGNALVVTSSTGDFAHFGSVNTFSATSFTCDQTAIYSGHVAGGYPSAARDAAGASTVTFTSTWSTSGSGGWAQLGFNIKAASGGGGPAGTIAISTPVTGQIEQRISGVADIAVAGTYTGTLTAIKARLVQYGTSTPVSGFDWETKVGSPSGNAYSFSFASVPTGTGWYSVQVQDTVDAGITATGGEVGVGELIGCAGQSNMNRFFNTSATTTDDLVRGYNVLTADGWDVLTGSGPEQLGNALVAAFDCPIGLVGTGVDGSAISEWAYSTPYTAAMAKFNALGGKLKALLFIQGERDWDGTTYSSYLTDLTYAMDSGFRTDLGQSSLPVILVANGSFTATTGSDTSTYAAVKQAQYDYAAGNANTYLVDRIDAELSGDGLHIAQAGAAKIGARAAQAIQYAYGLVSQYQGPVISSIMQVSATVYDVNFAHHMGSDITPSSGITGFVVTDPGAGDAAITVASTVRQSATVVRITLATTPVALPVFTHADGPVPNVSSLARDDGALTLPLGWTHGITATVPPTTVDLAAAAAAQAAATAALSKSATLSAAALGVSTATAGVALSVPLSATAQASASVSAGLMVTVGFAANAVASAAASAVLAISKPLAAGAVAQANGSAAMAIQKGFAAAAAGQASSTAQINLAKMLAANAQALAAGTASLTVTGGNVVDLSAAAQAVATSSASLALVINLSAIALAQASASGALAGAAGLAAQAIASAQASAAMAVGKPLAGAGQAQAAAGASLFIQIPLSAAALSVASAGAAMSLSIPLSAIAIANGIASATLSGPVTLSANGVAVASVTATLQVNVGGVASAGPRVWRPYALRRAWPIAT